MFYSISTYHSVTSCDRKSAEQTWTIWSTLAVNPAPGGLIWIVSSVQVVVSLRRSDDAVVTSDTPEVGCWWDRSQALRCCDWSAGPLLIGLDSKDSWERCLTCCLEMWRQKVFLWRLLLLHLYYWCFSETPRSPVTHNESLIRLFQRKAENRNKFLLEKWLLMFQNSWSLSIDKCPDCSLYLKIFLSSQLCPTRSQYLM